VQQLDLFSTPSSPSSPLIDQHIRLDRVCSCGSNIAIIGSSSSHGACRPVVLRQLRHVCRLATTSNRAMADQHRHAVRRATVVIPNRRSEASGETR
jgi:hypothetical protein